MPALIIWVYSWQMCVISGTGGGHLQRPREVLPWSTCHLLIQTPNWRGGDNAPRAGSQLSQSCHAFFLTQAGEGRRKKELALWSTGWVSAVLWHLLVPWPPRGLWFIPLRPEEKAETQVAKEPIKLHRWEVVGNRNLEMLLCMGVNLLIFQTCISQECERGRRDEEEL